MYQSNLYYINNMIKIVLAILNPLDFHTNLKINFSVSKKEVGILIEFCQIRR